MRNIASPAEARYKVLVNLINYSDFYVLDLCLAYCNLIELPLAAHRIMMTFKTRIDNRDAVLQLNATLNKP